MKYDFILIWLYFYSGFCKTTDIWQYEEHQAEFRKKYLRKGFKEGLKEMETNPSAVPKIQEDSSSEERE